MKEQKIICVDRIKGVCYNRDTPGHPLGEVNYMSEERKQALQYLKTVRGQIDGIIRMIEERRYCIDISNQISASTALLKKANQQILSGHLHSCVLQAIEEQDAQEKIKEMEDVITALLK